MSATPLCLYIGFKNLILIWQRALRYAPLFPEWSGTYVRSGQRTGHWFNPSIFSINFILPVINYILSISFDLSGIEFDLPVGGTRVYLFFQKMVAPFENKQRSKWNSIWSTHNVDKIQFNQGRTDGHTAKIKAVVIPIKALHLSRLEPTPERVTTSITAADPDARVGRFLQNLGLNPNFTEIMQFIS